MAHGNIIGYDINPEYCQISYYNEKTSEPETMETLSENGHIPLAVNYYKEQWTYGRNALRMDSVKGSVLVDHLLDKALSNEIISIEGNQYDPIDLLTEFIKETLKNFEEIESITFCVPELNEDIRFLLKGIGQKIGIDKNSVYVEDYKESFCHYMFNQPKELWQYEVALFQCEKESIKAYMLRKLKTGYRKGKENFVTVIKVDETQMEELLDVYPVLNVDKAKEADELFRRFIQKVFGTKTISSVFLAGEGFENDWYSNSRRVLCNGRRAFVGDNLYSKGACYTAINKYYSNGDGPVYLDETKLNEQICMKMRIRGEEGWFPLVSWGTQWYDSDNQVEVLLEDTSDIEIHVDSLVTGKVRVETVPLTGLPERKNYALRLRISTHFANEKKCIIKFEDVGFGEFFPSTGFEVEKIIELGGSDGQFDSLS